jgi:hypothetical protein
LAEGSHGHRWGEGGREVLVGGGGGRGHGAMVAGMSRGVALVEEKL